MKLEEIIKGCINQDRKAQRMLFELVAPNLLTVSRQYTPHGFDSMDNLQDSFIKIFDRIHQFDASKGSFNAWSRKIVINTALNKLNKNKIDQVVLQYDGIEIPEEQFFNKSEDIEYLMQIIEQLPDGYKQVFCMYEIEGYSHKEIAEQLNIKEATSRSQLSKSKQLLKSWMLKLNSPVFLKIQSE